MAASFQLFLALVFLSACGSSTEISCRDDSGNPVDWFYAYKLPQHNHSAHPNVMHADGYVYLLSSQREVYNWTVSTKGIQSDQSMMGSTLSPLYTQPRTSDIAYVLYNDENPDGTTAETKGHSKGVLVLSPTGALWLLHSVPRFPPWIGEPYSFPASGLTYGQGFFCVTMELNEIDQIGVHFQYSRPNVYNYSLPPWTQTRIPNLYDAVINGKSKETEPWYYMSRIQSKAGLSFRTFSKHSKYGKDVYGDLIAPEIQSDIYVESWIHGKDRIASKCGSYDVMNVDAVYLKPLNYTFNSTFDHSKWAVAPENSVNFWICIGDNNHMVSQEKRGGVTICQQSLTAWKVYSSSVYVVQPCLR